MKRQFFPKFAAFPLPSLAAAQRNFIPFDSDKVCMGWTWYLGSLAAIQVSIVDALFNLLQILEKI